MKKYILTMGTRESSVGKVWPLSIKGNNVFCACFGKGKWQEGENIISLPYDLPFIVGEFSYIQRCCETYMSFQKEHCMHIDPIFYQDSNY
jgi:hypothetical protein